MLPWMLNIMERYQPEDLIAMNQAQVEAQNSLTELKPIPVTAKTYEDLVRSMCIISAGPYVGPQEADKFLLNGEFPQWVQANIERLMKKSVITLQDCQDLTEDATFPTAFICWCYGLLAEKTGQTLTLKGLNSFLNNPELSARSIAITNSGEFDYEKYKLEIDVCLDMTGIIAQSNDWTPTANPLNPKYKELAQVAGMINDHVFKEQLTEITHKKNVQPDDVLAFFSKCMRELNIKDDVCVIYGLTDYNKVYAVVCKPNEKTRVWKDTLRSMAQKHGSEGVEYVKKYSKFRTYPKKTGLIIGDPSKRSS